MKRLGVILALFVLLATFSVSTAPVKATSQYFIVVNGETQASLLTALNVSWEDYTPQYTISGNVIYFPSLKDLTRVLSGPDFEGPIWDRDKIETSLPLQEVTLKIYDDCSNSGYVQAVLNSTGIAWIWGRLYSMGGNGKAYFYYDAQTVASVSGNTLSGSSRKTYVYKENFGFGSNSTFKIQQNDGTCAVGSNPMKPSTNVHIFIVNSTGIGVQFSKSVPRAYQALNYVYTSAVVYVTFHVKDGLTGQGLKSVTVKDTDGSVLGTIDDGGTLQVAKGQHTFTFEKDGYWSKNITLDIQNNTAVNVELYPTTAAFKFSEFPENLSFYAGTENTLSFTVEPIETTATKNAYIRFSGITPEKVTVGGSEVSPENGKYYLGDVTGPVQVEVTFKAPESSGTKSFSITLDSFDVAGNAYTTTKTVTYEVRQLPFIINWPTWSVGKNNLMIVEQSGESYLIEVSVTDANGSEIFADSHVFNPYESYTFSFNLPDTGTYTLTIRAKGGEIVLKKEISAAYPVSLKTKTVTAAPGDVATVALELGNPGDEVVYYNITLSGSILGAPVTKAVSVAPGTTKTVYVDFKVPENPEFDAYTLKVEVSTGGAVVFNDTVTLTISKDAGFSLGLGGLSGSGPFGLPTWAWVILGLVAVGLIVRSRKKRR